MRRRRLILLAAACAVLAGGLIWFLTREREPSYNGKTLSDLIRQCNGPQPGTAPEAIRCLGSNAVPFLLAWIRQEPRPWMVQLDAFLKKVPGAANLSFTEKIVNRSVDAGAAFHALGPDADRAVPDLLRIVDDPRMPGRVLSHAQIALYGIGLPAIADLQAFIADRNHRNRGYVVVAYAWTCQLEGSKNALAAVPIFVRYLNDADEAVAHDAATALGKLKLEPALTVPALTTGLHDPRPNVRFASARSIGELGMDARSAVPDLVRALNDADARVRREATNALQQISPEMLEKAGAGEAEKH